MIDRDVSSVELNGERLHIGWANYIGYRFNGSGFDAKVESPESNHFDVPNPESYLRITRTLWGSEVYQ